MTPVELTKARLRWPRVIAMLALQVGHGFAERAVMRASQGDELYKAIVREAWQRRRLKRWLRTLTTT